MTAQYQTDANSNLPAANYRNVRIDISRNKPTWRAGSGTEQACCLAFPLCASKA